MNKSLLVFLVSMATAILVGCSGGFSGGGTSNSGTGNPDDPKGPPPPGVETPYEANLTWTRPTQYEDGSPLPIEEIQGYKIFIGDGEPTFSEDAVILVEDGAAEAYSIDFLVPGTYYFMARTVDITGVESRNSNVVSKEVTD